MQYVLHIHCSDANGPQCYVVRTLPVVLKTECEAAEFSHTTYLGCVTQY